MVIVLERPQGAPGRTGKLCWPKMINEGLNEKKKHPEGLGRGRPARAQCPDKGLKQWVEGEASKISDLVNSTRRVTTREENEQQDPYKMDPNQNVTQSLSHWCSKPSLMASLVIQSSS